MKAGGEGSPAGDLGVDSDESIRGIFRGKVAKGGELAKSGQKWSKTASRGPLGGCYWAYFAQFGDILGNIPNPRRGLMTAMPSKQFSAAESCSE